MSDRVTVRQARRDDREAVVSFTRDTWPERADDYIPRVFDEWVDTDGPDQRTFVATVDGEPVGLCQCVVLTDYEAWAQGMRVHPDYRGAGVSRRLSEALFEWAGQQGATVCRSMVFSWNTAGLGHARGLGYDPACAFRWIEPTPDPGQDASADADGVDETDAYSDLEAVSDPAVAWRAYRGSDADHELGGLGLDLEESWALAEVTEPRLAAAETALAVVDGDRARGMAYRSRTFERETDDGDAERWAEYGVGSWDDSKTLRSLAAAVARDAADAGADRARVLVPETPRHVSDAAYARLDVSDEPDFVLARDLTRYRSA